MCRKVKKVFCICAGSFFGSSVLDVETAPSLHLRMEETIVMENNKKLHFAKVVINLGAFLLREPIQQKTVKKKLCRWSICRTVLPKRTVLPIRTVLTGGTVLPTL